MFHLAFPSLHSPQVLSSVIASWSDVKNAVVVDPTTPPSELGTDYMSVVRNLNAGYLWMMINCFVSAGYVGLCLHWNVISIAADDTYITGA